MSQFSVSGQQSPLANVRIGIEISTGPAQAPAGGQGERGLDSLLGSEAFARLGHLGLGPQQPRQTMSSACKAIGDYLDGQGKGTLNTGELRNLAAGNQADGLGECPPGVKAAAQFLLAGPKAADGSGEPARWQKVETHDVAGADGLSGIGNFKAFAAQGAQQPQPSRGAGEDDGGLLALMKALGAIQEAQSALRDAMEQQLNNRIQSLMSSIAQAGQMLGALQAGGGQHPHGAGLMATIGIVEK